jgi:hypothetical protein
MFLTYFIPKLNLRNIVGATHTMLPFILWLRIVVSLELARLACAMSGATTAEATCKYVAAEMTMTTTRQIKYKLNRKISLSLSSFSPCTGRETTPPSTRERCWDLNPEDLLSQFFAESELRASLSIAHVRNYEMLDMRHSTSWERTST